jgi:hypothetical protein
MYRLSTECSPYGSRKKRTRYLHIRRAFRRPYTETAIEGEAVGRATRGSKRDTASDYLQLGKSPFFAHYGANAEFSRWLGAKRRSEGFTERIIGKVANVPLDVIGNFAKIHSVATSGLFATFVVNGVANNQVLTPLESVLSLDVAVRRGGAGSFFYPLSPSRLGG